MSAVANVPARDFEFFSEIIDSFKKASDSAAGPDLNNMHITPFLDAMTTFLRIFDAFSNPFFSDVVKKDVQGNIKKLRDAAGKTDCLTLGEVVDKEMADPKLAKLIKKESGIGCNTGTVALLWMKRTMQFVIGMLQRLVQDSSITLSSASRESYSKTLRSCHNMITRGVFDTGLRFAPTRESFFKNLAGGGDTGRVHASLSQFLFVFTPQLDMIIAMYKKKELEPYIKV